MQKIKYVALTLLMLAGTVIGGPVKLVFDTDLGNDVDDVLALAMIHAMQSRGECELLAVTLTKDNPKAASLADAINTFYGRGNIPVGIVRDGPTPEEGRFLGMVDRRDGAAARYPFRLTGGKDTPEATALLRRILAAQPDASVVIVQVGFFSNLARLLESPPDAVSPLSGRALVAAKVNALSVMAGAFIPINGKRHLEYNVIKDIPAARKVAADWPTPILWSGYEIGVAIRYPATSIERDYGYVAHHPVVEAYRLYDRWPHNRPTWDLTSVLQVVRAARGYFELSPPGQVTVATDGETLFTPDPAGAHRYLRIGPEQSAHVQEAFINLCSQPPAALMKP